MIHIYSFPKAEKVWGKKNVDELFAKGRWSSAGELRYCWVVPAVNEESAGTPPSRAMVSVPKKFFKRAVKRNLLKRRIREAYRLQKGILEGKCVSVLFSYGTDQVMDFERIYSLVGEILKTISAKLDASA